MRAEVAGPHVLVSGVCSATLSAIEHSVIIITRSGWLRVHPGDHPVSGTYVVGFGEHVGRDSGCAITGISALFLAGSRVSPGR